MQREDKMGSDKSAPSSAQGGHDRMNAQGQKGSMENKGSMEQKGAQTNRAARDHHGQRRDFGPVAAPPAEKQTQIGPRSSRRPASQETTNVNFNISVGTVVPASVHFYPLPPRIVEIYPEWRGYRGHSGRAAAT